jgi:hypothetical protein
MSSRQEQPEIITVQIAPTHLHWLRQTAAHGNMSIDVALFWVLEAARRAKEPPWPRGAQGWNPWGHERSTLNDGA